MQTQSSGVDVTALMQRIQAGLGRITFDKDDAGSIRASIFAARHMIEVEVWPYRDNGPVITACRELWDEVLEAVLAYRDRAHMSKTECDWLSQWQPMPGQNYGGIIY